MSVKQLPYGIQTNKSVLGPGSTWCKEQWGPRWEAIGNRQGTWCVFWAGPATGNTHPSMYQWWFETEEQRTWFTLKWT
jgi:hypothetical protein